jgi:voltage-gated potassium channel
MPEATDRTTGRSEPIGAEQTVPSPRPERWLERRVERKGLRPRYAAYAIIGFWGAAIIVFGLLERLIDPNTFKSGWLGIWWATQTVTTVGYGDVVPQQTAGQVIAVILMLGGLSLLSVVTAAITSGFVSRAQEARSEGREDPVMRKLDAMAVQLEQLDADVVRLQRTSERGKEA